MSGSCDIAKVKDAGAKDCVEADDGEKKVYYFSKSEAVYPVELNSFIFTKLNAGPIITKHLTVLLKCDLMYPKHKRQNSRVNKGQDCTAQYDFSLLSRFEFVDFILGSYLHFYVCISLHHLQFVF